jgi:hypothetical protein
MRELPILEHILTAVALAAVLPVLVAIADPGALSAAAQTASPYQSPTVRSLGTMPAGQAAPGTAEQAMPMSTAPVNAGQGEGTESNQSGQALQPVNTGSTVYITGGVGDEERNEIQTARPNYNLWITSSTRDGAFVGDTHITVSDHQGNRLIDEAAAGPLFYARLPAGSYIVTAEAHGQSETRHVTVGRKGVPLHFAW